MTKRHTQVEYPVVDRADVLLSITFGNGQLGASAVTGAAAIVGEVKNWTVGSGATLRGRAITIHSVLTDVNRSTNRLSATYMLTGGQHPQTLLLDSVADAEGDSDHYHVTVIFV